MNSSKGKIIYVGDPMCSWCWGIANELQKLKDQFVGIMKFELILGGLRPGGGEEWNKGFQDFLREHWEHVAKASGQEFNFDLLSWPNFDYDTEPPSRAIVIARKYLNRDDFLFFKDVQKGFYVDNMDTGNVNSYESICKKFMIPFDEFRAKMEMNEMKQLAYEDFAIAAKYGVRGFPSVLVEIEGNLTYVANGYSTYEKMNERVKAFLKQV